ncbi:MAG: NTP transferase domain-containing protein [Burkholderiales bacterium]|jgi:molybdenum cofactor cytidylyltransferase
MITGILLAAGSGSRFGADKLLHPLGDGTPIGLASLRALKRALPNVIAVIRTGDDRLRACLDDEQVAIYECDDAHLGMAHSFVCGIEASRDADGWVIALGDMPFVQPRTISSVAARVAHNGRIIIPAYRGQRGHPVGFGGRYLRELQNLSGDEGARSVIGRHSGEVELLEADDEGILRDIDTRADLKSTS